MGAAFSPAEQTFPLPAHPQSARFRQALSELGSDAEFRDGVEPLRTLGVQTAFKTIERVCEAVGTAVAAERHGALAVAQAQDEHPEQPAELLVVEADGLRVRLRLDENAAPAPLPAEEGTEERDRGWRECKAGVVARCLPGYFKANGEYEEPQTLVQTYLATMSDIEVFGPRLRAETERRGWKNAKKIWGLSDAGHGLPGMWSKLFPEAEWGVDFMHVSGRLAECAAQVQPPGKACHKLYHRWKGLLFQGKMAKLQGELRTAAERHSPRPAAPSALLPESPARILWTHLVYLETYQEHMDYPRYRAAGLPIGSGLAEALCKRIGGRMKGANKRWTAEGAEAMSNLICERASQDNRWARRWPAPVCAEKVQLN